MALGTGMGMKVARFFSLPESHSNGRIEVLSLPAGVAGFSRLESRGSEEKKKLARLASTHAILEINMRVVIKVGTSLIAPGGQIDANLLPAMGDQFDLSKNEYLIV